MPGRKKGMTPQRAERARKVVDLRALGLTYEQIGRNLGISVKQASLDFRAAQRDAFRESMEEMVMVEFRRLEDVHRAFVRVMMDTERPIKDRGEAAKHILKASEQRAKLMGMNSAIKVEVKEVIYSPLEKLAEAILAEAGEDVDH